MIKDILSHTSNTTSAHRQCLFQYNHVQNEDQEKNICMRELSLVHCIHGGDHYLVVHDFIVLVSFDKRQNEVYRCTSYIRHLTNLKPANK